MFKLMEDQDRVLRSARKQGGDKGRMSTGRDLRAEHLGRDVHT